MNKINVLQHKIHAIHAFGYCHSSTDNVYRYSHVYSCKYLYSGIII